MKRKLEAMLGADFSDVRVHVGSQPGAIGAVAFTSGSDLYFAPGYFQPETAVGTQLLVCQLRRVLQQRTGRVTNPFGRGVALVPDLPETPPSMKSSSRGRVEGQLRVQPKTLPPRLQPLSGNEKNTGRGRLGSAGPGRIRAPLPGWASGTTRMSGRAGGTSGGQGSLKLTFRLHKDGTVQLKGPNGIGRRVPGGNGIDFKKAPLKRRKKPQVRYETDTVTFHGEIDVYYARVPVQGHGGHPAYLVSGQDVARHHFNPPEVRPANLNPHWVDGGVSWPAVYVRAGAANGPHARGLQATFSATGRFTGPMEIRAVSPNGIDTNTVTVNFVGGQGNGNFTLRNLPGTVRVLSGMELHWQCRRPGLQLFRNMNESRHTLYIVDETPLVAVGQNEHHFFEMIDWACRWADGQVGAGNVLAQIWNRFNPVVQDHATGFMYWRNHASAVAPAQNVATALQYQDQGINERRAASCVVFDRVLMNCLAVHGIRSAEVRLEPAQYATPLLPLLPLGPPVHGFSWGIWPSYYLNPTAWVATTVAAHGNMGGAPDTWQNHWIAAIHTGAGGTGWQLYDASYGLGPFDCAAPGLVNALHPIPQAYDAAAVAHFPCNLWSTDGVNLAPVQVDHLASASPNPPHLIGTILATN
ncbi:DUF4157 domain-containing protein [Corallococcus sp. AB038B]|uniref:eCIS core domain-containing protein n=1 Tax=Corallococcus sp. AB038B TaxID=2316718 RepID=UPI0013153F37|nr:DUF4157 domain-containing protein [Corallococcus sp. AB038B]